MHSCVLVWGQTVEYRYPPLFKSSLHATSLLRKTYIVLIFANQKKSKEGFHSYKKRWKVKIARSACFEGADAEAVGTWSRVALPRGCAQHLGTKLPRLWSAPALHLGLLCASRASPWLSGKECTRYAGDLGSILGGKDPLEKEMETHSSVPAWEFLWSEEPGGLQSTGSQRVEHDWVQR